MSGALLGHREVTQDMPSRRIQFDEPPRRSRILVKPTQGRPKRVIIELQRIAPANPVECSQIPSIEAEELDSAVLTVGYVHRSGTANLDRMR